MRRVIQRRKGVKKGISVRKGELKKNRTYGGNNPSDKLTHWRERASIKSESLVKCKCVKKEGRVLQLIHKKGKSIVPKTLKN